MRDEQIERLAASALAFIQAEVGDDLPGMSDQADRFARALAPVVDAMVAEVYEEGYADAIGDYGCDAPWGGTKPLSNPYRGGDE